MSKIRVVQYHTVLYTKKIWSINEFIQYIYFAFVPNRSLFVLRLVMNL